MNTQINILNQPVNMTIPEITHVMYLGKKYNDAKVCLHVRDGVRWLCIRKRQFDTYEACLNFLREDGRSIMAPENRPAYFKKMGMLAEMEKAELDLALAA
jgi:hypothetical protein